MDFPGKEKVILKGRLKFTTAIEAFLEVGGDFDEVADVMRGWLFAYDIHAGDDNMCTVEFFLADEDASQILAGLSEGLHRIKDDETKPIDQRIAAEHLLLEIYEIET